jgi:predicted DNA-binding mobile mystery protein A
MLQRFKQTRGLLLRQIEQKLAPWRPLPRRPPAMGWLRTVREALGMSAPQLARRLGVTRQGLADLERRERQGTVTLAALSKAAEALDCNLVYAIVPRSELSTLIQAQARSRAQAEVQKVTHTMRLEAQEVPSEEAERLIHERTMDLLSKSPRKLWDMRAGENTGSARKRPFKGKGRGSADR